MTGTMKEHQPEMSRYDITHGGSTTEAIVIQYDSKTVIQPVNPITVAAGESFTITVSN